MTVVAVVGLGYVGLPLAIEFGKRFRTIGIDLSAAKVTAYLNHQDPTGEVDLRLPQPDINLGVGSGSHAVQTAEVMRRFEPVLDDRNPSAVVVVGDVNSTLACTLVAVKKGVPVVHVEAGLRSYDRVPPEEINRLLTDQIADRLYITERSAEANLLREGIAAERVCFVGNVMIDSLLDNKAQTRDAEDTLSEHGFAPSILAHPKGYGVVTLHRPSNADDPKALGDLMQVLAGIAEQLPLVFVLHPRTKSKLKSFGLMAPATLLLTDSGGLQEETTVLGVPCLTLCENTERPIMVDQGTNTVVGRDLHEIRLGVAEILAGRGKRGRVPELWDGHATERIADDLSARLRSRAA